MFVLHVAETKMLIQNIFISVNQHFLYVTLVRQGSWTGWPTEVPSNPYHSMILWFFDKTLALDSGFFTWNFSV